MSLNLQLRPQAKAWFTTAAQERGVEPSELLEEIITAQFAPGRDPLSGKFPQLGGLTEEDFKTTEIRGVDDTAAKRTIADIVREVGGIKGLSSDMSRNKAKYLKGFGETKP